MQKENTPMGPKEISLVLGTAGHIDHGKTTLVRAITGVDCDRLFQEKKRGITIELGFAPLKLPSNRVVSLVDVPGHEKFIRQMVAGASGIDAVMLVVAADEGIMPQTREHLDILNLLGVRDGFVAVTKTDLVDPELCDLAVEEIRDFLKGTFLQDKAVIPVSSIKGENLEEVLKELESLVNRVETRNRKGPFFMPLDRAFAVSGFGTVVTGTSYSGKITKGQDVDILPADLHSRIRSIQVHSQDVEEGWAGQRIALSLTGVSVNELERGDVICEKGIYEPTSCIDAFFRLLPSSPEPLRHWQRIRLHVGTSDVLARVSLLDEKIIEPGGSAYVQLVTEDKIMAAISERFVARFYSPLKTIGGGEVLFTSGRKPRGKRHRENYLLKLNELAESNTLEEKLKVLVNSRGKLGTKDAVPMLQQREQKLFSAASKLHQSGDAVLIESPFRMLISKRFCDSITKEITEFLKNYHEKYPHQKGAVIETLSLQVRDLTDPKTLRSVLLYLREKGVIDYEDGFASLPGFSPRDEEDFRNKTDFVRELCISKGFVLPDLQEIRGSLDMDEKEFSNFLMHLRNMKEVAIIQGQLVLHREMEEKLVEMLSRSEEDITLGYVRDLTGSSRKYILPLLEYMDSRGYTRRVGDKRIFRA
jgi:selenocysteine-specific elongation factor